MFGRRKKSIADSAAKLLNGSPAAPSIDDIATDLESAAADDPVFVREVPRAESALVQERWSRLVKTTAEINEFTKRRVRIHCSNFLLG